MFKFRDGDHGGYGLKKVLRGWRRVHGLVT